MNRNNKGWLRVADLILGQREEYQCTIGTSEVTVVLCHDSARDQFHVIEHQQEEDGTYTLTATAYGRQIDQARRAFSRLRAQYSKTSIPNRLERTPR